MKTLVLFLMFILGVIAPSIYKHTLEQNGLFFFPVILLFVSYGAYKIKFGKFNMLKLYIYRKLVFVKWFYKSFTTHINKDTESIEILPIQAKSKKLWKLLLKDGESQISCSLSNRIRQIEKDNMLLLLSPVNQVDFLLTIMDVDNNKSCLYEIPISGKFSENLIELFDNENERRMNLGKNEKRQSINNDLDKLISQQEQSIKIKNFQKTVVNNSSMN